MKRKFIFAFKFVYMFSDAFTLLLAFFLANYMRHGFFAHPAYNRLIMPVLLVFIFFFYHYKFYNKLQLTYVYELFRIIRAGCVAFGFIIVFTFFWRPFAYSRLMLTYFLLLSVILIFAEREMLKIIMDIGIRKFFLPDKILVIGRGKIVRALKRRLRLKHQAALWINHYPDEGELRSFVQNRGFSGVVIANFSLNHGKVVDIANLCEQLGADFQLVPDILELKLGDLVMDEFFGIPLLKFKPTPLTGTHLMMKNAFDVVATIAGLAVLMPFFLIIAALIKLDSRGKVIYSHVRRGRKGRDFKFYKFRTMVKNADSIFKKERNDQYKNGGLLFKKKNDSRVTRIGGFLRKFSLDEFPQLLNVLKGNMSIVGPRPQIISEAAGYDSSAKRRLRIKPGITGLWQVSGRSDLSYEEMVRLDIFYVQNWSMEEDFRILLRTVPAVFFGKGAY
ncbi:MAG: sugar transferase [Elusimicrobiota bacterium]|nr:sugar transferase [Elusimicrobiota bacterium]